MYPKILSSITTEFEAGGLFNIDQTYYAMANETPQSKQSTRFGKSRTGKSIAYTSAKKKAYMASLSLQFKATYNGPVLDCPVQMTAIFFFAYPKSKKNRKDLSVATARADLDNLLKPVKDSLSGIAYVDDKQIVAVKALKLFADAPGIYIIIDTIELK